MGRGLRIGLASIFLFSGIILESIIFWLFPFTGLGGIICWPLTIILSIILGVLFYFLSTIPSKGLVFLSALVLFIFQTYLLLFIHPQDFGGDTFSQIALAQKAIKKYDSLRYDDYSRINRKEKAVYAYKFKERLPLERITITIDDNQRPESRIYLIDKTAEGLVFDASKLDILQQENATVLIEYVEGDTLSYQMSENFLTKKSIIINRSGYRIRLQAHNYRLKTGIQKLIYRIVSFTKKSD